jgi:cysteine synthase A
VLGREILDQVGDTVVDAFCAAVGTAGMLVGVASALRAGESRPQIVALEPATSPALMAGTGGPHRVEGTATGILPPLLIPNSFDEVRTVEESDARRLPPYSRYRGRGPGPEVPGR